MFITSLEDMPGATTGVSLAPGVTAPEDRMVAGNLTIGFAEFACDANDGREETASVGDIMPSRATDDLLLMATLDV